MRIVHLCHWESPQKTITFKSYLSMNGHQLVLVSAAQVENYYDLIMFIDFDTKHEEYSETRT